MAALSFAQRRKVSRQATNREQVLCGLMVKAKLRTGSIEGIDVQLAGKKTDRQDRKKEREGNKSR